MLCASNSFHQLKIQSFIAYKTLKSVIYFKLQDTIWYKNPTRLTLYTFSLDSHICLYMEPTFKIPQKYLIFLKKGSSSILVVSTVTRKCSIVARCRTRRSVMIAEQSRGGPRPAAAVTAATPAHQGNQVVDENDRPQNPTLTDNLIKLEIRFFLLLLFGL